LVTLPLLVLRDPTRRPSIQKGTGAGIERFLVSSVAESKNARQHINIGSSVIGCPAKQPGQVSRNAKRRSFCVC
jgi:hypothetical protein